MTRALVVCDGASVPADVASEAWTAHRDFWSSGPQKNILLHGENLGCKLITTIADRTFDLIRIASYAYAADQDLSRGGDRDAHGRDWRRHITLCVPVTDPAFWAMPRIVDALGAVLHFATDDEWRFSFDRIGPERRRSSLFEETGEAVLLGHPDCVALFSGGADSLCSAIETIAEQGRKPVLVSHRSTMLNHGRQRRLADELRRRFGGWWLPHLGFPIRATVNRLVEKPQD